MGSLKYVFSCIFTFCSYMYTHKHVHKNKHKYAQQALRKSAWYRDLDILHGARRSQTRSPALKRSYNISGSQSRRKAV